MASSPSEGSTNSSNVVPPPMSGQLRLEPGVLVLLGEAQRRSGHHQGEDGVRVAPDLRRGTARSRWCSAAPTASGRSGRRSPRTSSESRRPAPSRRRSRCDRHDLLVAERLGRVLAEGMVGLARRPAGAHHPLGGLALGEVVGGDDGIEHRDPVLVDLRRQRVADVGEDAPASDVDLVALDQLAELGQRELGWPWVSSRSPPPCGRHLVAVLVEPHLKPVGHVLADCGGAAGDRREEADLDRPLLGRPQGRPRSRPETARTMTSQLLPYDPPSVGSG